MLAPFLCIMTAIGVLTKSEKSVLPYLTYLRCMNSPLPPYAGGLRVAVNSLSHYGENQEQ